MYSKEDFDEIMDLISPKLMIICGTLMFILGLIGNILNVYVFTVWSNFGNVSKKFSRKYRNSQCPLYLLVSSLANLVVVIYPLLTRIMFDGYDFAITKNKSFFFCKLRYFVLHSCDFISLFCICLATFDRFVITSRNARLRMLSASRFQSMILIVLVIVSFTLHNFPLLIYYDASHTGRCSISSRFYSHYYFYVIQIILHSLIPMMFLSIFGFLTFRQLKSIGRINRVSTKNRDKQLSRMLVLISLAIIISSIPYCIEQFYVITTSKENNYSSSSFIFLYHVISSILFYVNPVTSFFIFFISSPNFRLQIRKLFRFDHGKIEKENSPKQKIGQSFRV